MLGLIAPHVLVNEMCWLAFKDAQDKAGAKELALFDLLDSAECKHFKSQSNRQICKMLPPTSKRQQATGSGNRNSNNYGNRAAAAAGATICEGAIRVAGRNRKRKRNRKRNKAKRIHHPRLTFKGQRWSINQSARWG